MQPTAEIPFVVQGVFETKKDNGVEVKMLFDFDTETDTPVCHHCHRPLEWRVHAVCAQCFVS